MWLGILVALIIIGLIIQYWYIFLSAALLITITATIYFLRNPVRWLYFKEGWKYNRWPAYEHWKPTVACQTEPRRQVALSLNSEMMDLELTREERFLRINKLMKETEK